MAFSKRHRLAVGALLTALALPASPNVVHATTIDPAALTLMAVVHTRGEYDNTGLGTWNGSPLSATNEPTYDQDQLSADWSFYVDPGHSNDLFVLASNVYDTQYGYISGTPFSFVALTGFDFAMSIFPHLPSSPADFSNEWAVPGQALLGPVAGASVVLSTTPGWTLADVSGLPIRYDYLISTPDTADGLTHFSSVTGTTRISGGAAFEFQFDPTINLFGDAKFDSLQADAYFGLGNYIGEGRITYLNTLRIHLPIPEPDTWELLFTGIVLIAFIKLPPPRHNRA